MDLRNTEKENSEGKYGMPYRREGEVPQRVAYVFSNDYVIQRLKGFLTQEDSLRKFGREFVNYFKKSAGQLRQRLAGLSSHENYSRLGTSVMKFLIDIESNLKDMEAKAIATESEMHNSELARAEINDLMNQSPQNLREVVKQETLRGWETSINLKMKETVENINLFRKAAETFFEVANDQVTEIENILKEPQKTQA